jgi:hypothetical protein
VENYIIIAASMGFGYYRQKGSSIIPPLSFLFFQRYMKALARSFNEVIILEQSLNIKRFLDDTGKIKQLPEKQKMRRALLEYLAEKFEPNCDYTERDVNDICNLWNTFGDCFILRRELVDNGLLCRERDGSRYWRAPSTQIIQK